LHVAINAIERGIERRSPRVWAPRWVGAILALRGVLQPLLERRILADMPTLEEGLRLSEEAAAASAGFDPKLGVSAEALPEREHSAVG
jgi:hypothetical protein